MNTDRSLIQKIEDAGYIITESCIIKDGVSLKPFMRGEYFAVSLKYNGKSQTQSFHRIMALKFIPNPENKPQVNHKDCNKLNNCISNLEWCTPGENVRHSFKNGLQVMPKGLLSKFCKPINQFSINGDYIRSWDSINQASEELKIHA